MDCLNCADQQLRDIMAQMDEYSATLEPDIYTFNATPMTDSSGSPVLSTPLFPPCPSPVEALMNPYNLSRNLSELKRHNNNSCDSSNNNSMASSQDLRSNSNEGIHEDSSNKVLYKATVNPCAVRVRGLNYFQADMDHHNTNNYSSEDGGVNNYGRSAAASMAAMREMIFRVAAMQPISIDPETIKRPKRRNVRISKDPQSVAARHRREKISERIRILQRLVPGGTKMDTAAMLDEAIHYVKFLKRQVQALEVAAAAGAGTTFRQFNHNFNPTLNYSAFSTNSSYPTSAFFAASDNPNSNSVTVCNNGLLL